MAIIIQREGTLTAARAKPFSSGGGATFGRWTTLLKDFLTADIPEFRALEEPDLQDVVLPLLNSIREHRNDAGHAFSFRQAHERDAEVQRLEPIVVASLEALPWLSRMQWDLVEHCHYTRAGYQLIGRRLRGSHPDWEPLNEKSTEPLDSGSLYLRGPLVTGPIDLGPVAVVEICPSCGQRELFLINKATLTGNTVVELTLRSDKDHEIAIPMS